MTPLADARSKLAVRYDAIVVGSGYGGAIAAARLAERGKSVCVLERGREWLPGDFPKDEKSLAAAVRTPLNPLGLIDPNTQIKNDIDVVVGCGLGGTSLINAAIALRPEPDVFEQKEWPKAIRDAARDGSLDRFFDRARAMLGAHRWEGLAEMSKVKAHRAAAEARGVPWDTLTLAITREACIDCGDCVAGCNAGAKNTLAKNYLPHAKKHGARIFTGMEVTRITPDAGGDGYAVHFRVHGTGAMHDEIVRAPIVVLGAGSLGSTEILLRSQSEHFPFSDRLGDSFSANADVLGMSYNGRAAKDSLGYGHTGVRRDGWPVGSTISSFGDYRAGKEEMQERFLLLEGAIPGPLVTLVARAIGTYAMTRAAEFDAEQRARTLRDLVPLTHPGPDSAVNHSMLFLACGHDSASGKLVLAERPERDARVHVVWPGVAKERWLEAIQHEMKAHAREHGGIFIENPRSNVLGGKRQMTVHPLGGCPMGDDASSGAVDDRGRVFARDGSVHRGLFVVDGAIVPRSLGVTPLLTISALAERAAETM